MKKTIIYITLLLLISCAARPNWVQEGKTRQAAKYDAIQCYDEQLKQHAGFEGLTDQEIYRLMSACMKTKGYHDESKTQK